MAYVSSDSPLPQNSRMAPPQSCVDRSNALIALAEHISRSGRLRLYGTVPQLDSFVAFGPGVTTNAALMLQQSDLARSSVVSSGTPPADSSTLVGTEVEGVELIPLNWTPQLEGVRGCAPHVPAAVLVEDQPSVVMPERMGSRIVRSVGAAARPASLRRPRPGRTSGFPPWGDAAVYETESAGGLLGWIERNPWLAAGLVGLAVVAATGRRRGR